MVRQRRPQGISESNKINKGTNSSSSNGSSSPNSKFSKNSNLLNYWKQVMGFTVLGIAIYFGYIGYLETRVNTPLDDKKVVVQSGLDVPDQFWGTYRPGVYFGLKTREPNSIVTGLMWYFPGRLRPGGDGIRHWCEQGDNLERYGWLKHDGSNFGIQEIIDGPFKLVTSFVKRPNSHGGEWTARISVDTKLKKIELNEEVSLIWYTALDEETKGYITATNFATKLTGIRGQTPSLGEFTLKFSNQSGTLHHESFVSTRAPGLHLLKETIISSLRLAQENPKSPTKIVLGGEILPIIGTKKDEPNFVAIQLTGKVPFTIDVVFESETFSNKQETLVGEAYTKSLSLHEVQFNERFETTFNLRNKGYTDREVTFAQAALSNMVGGIGYFFGSSKVQSIYTKEPVPYWPAPLYTAVPSRRFLTLVPPIIIISAFNKFACNR